MRIIISIFMLLVVVMQPLHANDDPGIINLKQTEKAFAKVAKKVSEAVVYIQVEQDMPSRGGSTPFPQDEIPPFLEEFFKYFGQPYKEQGSNNRHITGQGSGFFISKDGYIVTNNHVVSKASKITVKMLDGDEHDAKLIGSDKQSDIALLKVDGSNFPYLELGDSDQIEVGEWAIAVGNPFGLTHSLSVGIISAKGRSSIGITDYENFIQTDAAINPGNSGGPLTNIYGKVIGINTAIFSQSGGNLGIGFAIPANMANSIIEQLKDDGSVTRGFLGVRIQELTKDLAQSFGVKENTGILIASIEKGSPADKAGLKNGDVILKLDGKRIENVADFRNTIALSPPGTKHKIEISRKRKNKTIHVKIGALGENNDLGSDVNSKTYETWGIQIRNLNKELAKQLGLSKTSGVVIYDVLPGSVAQFAGMRQGTMILEVNQQEVNSVAEFSKYVNNSGKRVTLYVSDRNGERYITLMNN